MTDYARSRDWGIYGIGIGVPSVVDKGVVLFANNLPELDNQQLDLALAEFNLPVFIDNDANLMGLGEVIYGAAKGLSDIVFLTVGTGIGGALFLNGRLYGGYRNRGTELGHLIIHGLNGNQCTCGGTRFRKCVDRLISAIIGEERTGDTFPYRWKIYSRAL